MAKSRKRRKLPYRIARRRKKRLRLGDSPHRTMEKKLRIGFVEMRRRRYGVSDRYWHRLGMDTSAADHESYRQALHQWRTSLIETDADMAAAVALATGVLLRKPAPVGRLVPRGHPVFPLSGEELTLTRLGGRRIMDLEYLYLCPRCGGFDFDSLSLDHAGSGRHRNGGFRSPTRCIEHSHRLNVGAFVHIGCAALSGAPMPLYLATYNSFYERIDIMANRQVDSAIRATSDDGGTVAFSHTRNTGTDDDDRMRNNNEPAMAVCKITVTDKDGKSATVELDGRTFSAWTRVALGALDRD